MRTLLPSLRLLALLLLAMFTLPTLTATGTPAAETDDPTKPGRSIASAIAEAAPDAPQAAALATAVMNALNEDAKLTASDGAADDEFGYSVSLSGDRALIGAHGVDDNGFEAGAAYVFDFDGAAWTETQKLTASDGASDAEFGASVSLSGDRALIGAYGDDDNGFSAGAAYVFDLEGGAWTETQKLTASDGTLGDQFGVVSLSGDRALIGAYGVNDNGSNAGAAYVFDFDGTAWTETQKLTASSSATGDEFFGWSVSLSGERALIGAFGDDDNGSSAGAAYVFDLDGTAWSETQKLTASDGAAFHEFGASVSLSGDRALIGAFNDDDNGFSAGAAYVFDLEGGAWSETQKLTASDGAAFHEFGYSVSLSGDRALIGAYQDDDNGDAAGAAYIFDFDGTAWTETTKLTALDGAADDRFGVSVSLSGDRALIGAYQDDIDAGAAYIFDGAGPLPSITVTVAEDLYWPTDTVPVDIAVQGVFNLYGLSARLAYDAALVAYDAGSLALGPFLDDPTPLLFDNDDGAGSLAWSVSRTEVTGGVSGDGTAATMAFTVPTNTGAGAATLALSDLQAIDDTGTPISFNTINGGTFEVGGVWPGDTDNNCTVEAADLLPIGQYFDQTGPARAGYDVSWGAKGFSPWGGSSTDAEFSKSFVDADGDGQVDQGDVLAIGFNFGQTRAEATGCTTGAGKGGSVLAWTLAPTAPGTTVTLALQADAMPWLGTAFTLAVDPAAYRIEAIKAGGLLTGDRRAGALLEVVRVEAEAGTAQAAFTRRGAEAAVHEAGTLALIQLTALAGDGATLRLHDISVSTTQGIGPAGSAVTLAAAVAVAEADAVPTEFALHGAYPNPFNPTTTIAFDLPEASTVRLVVVDLLGRVVAQQRLGTRAAGANQQVVFSAEGLASGSYLYRLEVTGATATQALTGRFVLLK